MRVPDCGFGGVVVVPRVSEGMPRVREGFRGLWLGSGSWLGSKIGDNLQGIISEGGDFVLPFY